ncbi:hypothetical protein ACIQHY_12685 [Streptomyces sp. NPDC092359]|uniref:hypothetical protein n=1 Tax=Streptomyces sp. NPDC092359 TaxID=3366014 RepID=UPI0037FB54B6
MKVITMAVPCRTRLFEPATPLQPRRITGGLSATRIGAQTALAAFRREHLPLYTRFAATVCGNTTAGGRLARRALEELEARWPAALRSPSPSAYAWEVLTDLVTPHRTEAVRVLYDNLKVSEADALVLRHRLGCSPATAGNAMGLSPGAFELLRRAALVKATPH